MTASANISASGFIAGNSFRGSGRIYPDYNFSINHFFGKTTIDNPIIRAAGGLNVQGNLTASNNISASGNIVASNLSGTNTGDQDLSNLVTNLQTASFAITGSDVLFGNITASGNISSSGIITAEGLVISDDATITDDLTVNGNILVGQTNTIANASQTNTHIQFNSSQMLFDAGGVEVMRMGSTGAVFNIAGLSTLDFTIEGDTDQSLFFVDASADKVAIGTSTVGSALLTVDGDITATGILANITASGALSASVINGAGTGTTQLNVAGQITASGNISSSGDIIANRFVGDIATAAQPNITSVGTLTSLTAGTLRLTSTTDASATSTGHAFQSGPTSGANIIINGNEVMARNNSVVAPLYINPDGGMVAFQNSEANSVQIDHGHVTASGNISASGTITANAFVGNITGNVTGQADTVATITGLAPDTATTQAAQGNITSLGTLTSLTVAGNITANSNIVGDNQTAILGVKQLTTSDFVSSSRFITPGNISASGYVTSSGVLINPGSATQTAIQNAVKGGTYSLFVASSSANTNALIYSDSGHAALQLRSNSGQNAQILFNEDGTARYILGHVGSDDSFQIRNSSFMAGGDELFKLEFDGSGIKLGHDSGFHVTASGNISASGDLKANSIVASSHISASGGTNADFVVRPNLYFFATNTSAITMGGGSDFGGGTTDNQGSLPATNTTTVTLTQEHNSHANVFTLSSNRLTIARAGLYKITYNATLEINNGSGRCEGFAGLVQETSAGDVSLVDGSESRGYHRFVHSTRPSSVTYGACVIINAAASSIYDLRFGLTKQTLATQKLRTMPTGTSFLVEAMN